MKILLSIIFSFVTVALTGKCNYLALYKMSLLPQEVLLKADSLAQAMSLPKYKVYYMKSHAFHSITKFSKSIEYADSVLNSEEASGDCSAIATALILKVESCLQLERFEEAANLLRYSVSNQFLGKDSLMDANIFFLQGIFQYKMNKKESSYSSLNKAVSILEQYDGVIEKLKLSHVMGVLIGYYTHDKKYNEAWEQGLRRCAILNDVETKTPDIYGLDLEKGYCYSRMAYLALLHDRRVLAEEYYKKFKSTDMSATPFGCISINPFLLLNEMYENVVENSDRFYLYTDMNDVSSTIYRKTMYETSQAYNGLENYKWAYLSLMKYTELSRKYADEVVSDLLMEISGEIEGYSDIDVSLSDTDSVDNDLLMTIIYILVFVVIFLLGLGIFVLVKYWNERGSAERSSVWSRTESNLRSRLLS